MAIEKISAEDILGYKNRSTNEIKLMTANSYLSRLVLGFEDELLPFLNSPKRFISLDESTVGEVNATRPQKRVSFANSELGEDEINLVEDEKQNGRLDLYKKEIKEDYGVRPSGGSATEEIPKQSKNADGEGNADAIVDEYNNYYSEPTYIIDEDEMQNPDTVDEEVSLNDYLNLDNSKTNKYDTEEYLNEYAEGDDYYGEQEGEDFQGEHNEVVKNSENAEVEYENYYEDENEHNVDDERNNSEFYSDAENVNEANADSHSYKNASNTNNICGSDSLQSDRDFVSTSDVEALGLYNDNGEYVVANYKNLNDNMGASQISIKRQVYDISNLGELDKTRWSKLNEVTKKTLNKFNSLPSFAEFKKVKEAYDENDINDIVLDYQKLLVKYLNGGGEVLTQSIERLKEELKNTPKIN